MTVTDQGKDSNGRSWKELLARWAQATAGTNLPAPPEYSGPDVWLAKLTEKTSEVVPGACFIARVRPHSDGHPYVAEAIARGASLILAQRASEQLGLTLPNDVAYVRVSDTAQSLAWLAAAWEEFPSRSLVTIGITGTDGKTSTANLLYEILAGAGMSAGLLSTTRAVIGQREELLALHVTTPEAPIIQHHLRRMVDAGVEFCILESTSHGLAQHRVTAVEFDVALLTNITHEHLDEHGDYESYAAAKARLFEMVAAGHRVPDKPILNRFGMTKAAVLNRDDPSFEILSRLPYAKLISYGIEGRVDVCARKIIYAADKTTFTLELTPDATGARRRIEIQTPLPGEFTVYNMLAAAAAADHLMVPADLIGKGIESVKGIDGRMQRIERGQAFLTIVDFAHTPNALNKAIDAARRMCEGKVITVFGSAGKRDVQKRRLMAEVSARHADLTILTAEDPRDESLDAILEMMASGCKAVGGVEGDSFWRIRDRGRAIYKALTLAQPSDVVLICGKGHEQSMCFGITEYPWDDRVATMKALEAYLLGKPMPDLGLPTFDKES